MKYLNNVVEQLKDWLNKCSVQRLAVFISNTESGEVLERWQFDTESDKNAKDDSTPREKSQKALQDEMWLIDQTELSYCDISATVGSFLFI